MTTPTGFRGGNTMIVGPDGGILAGLLTSRPGTLTASLDMGALIAARREFDPIGHDARPDVFTLAVHQPAAASTDERGAPCLPPPSPASDTSR